MPSASDIGKELVARTPEMAGGLLRQIVEFGINGHPAFPGAKAVAVRELSKAGEREKAIDAIVVQHVVVASGQGLATSVGGLLTVPVTLPANIAAMAVLGVRMIGAIAHLRGYDVDDQRVRAAIMLALVGETEVARLLTTNKLPTSPLAVATAPMYDAVLERQVSEEVMASLAGRLGGKRLTTLALRRIPVVGGGVGAAVDGWFTHTLADYARREFVARQGNLGG
ncbi:MAG: EcsC family protein [Propionibacteriaceae bacterium]|jgi:hypothetical protein|nr:EcsC family protein [Propionibacteriaceae bacterium]